jgi:hypothetical protein
MAGHGHIGQRVRHIRQRVGEVEVPAAEETLSVQVLRAAFAVQANCIFIVMWGGEGGAWPMRGKVKLEKSPVAQVARAALLT